MGKFSDRIHFNPDGHQGDWAHGLTVTFNSPFPSIPIVVVTAADAISDLGDTDLSIPSIVGVVREVTQQDFTVDLRNGYCKPGTSSFNWMAVLNVPGSPQRIVPWLRIGSTSPSRFPESCNDYDTMYFDIPFQSLHIPPTVLLTATSLNTKGHPAAAVAIVDNSTDSQFRFDVRNSDCSDGQCSFNWIALSNYEGLQGDNPQYWIETGNIDAHRFEGDCNGDDTVTWDVNFDTPFLTPPVILLTSKYPQQNVDHVCAPVGIVQHATEYGFRLWARNSDSVGGYAGFSWIAIGLSQDCCKG